MSYGPNNIVSGSFMENFIKIKTAPSNILDKANLSDDIKCVLFHKIFGLCFIFFSSFADEKLWEIIEIPRF